MWWFFGGLLLLLAVLAGTSTWASEYVQCRQLGSVTHRKTEYYFISGCYVETAQGMVPVDRWWVRTQEGQP